MLTFALLCGASKGFLKTLVKPFATPQRSVKIKIELNFLFSSGIEASRIEIGKVNLSEHYRLLKIAKYWNIISARS